MKASTSQQRPYQGYPYTNPPVTDAPSLDPATAAKWTNLPRKPIEISIHKDTPAIYINIPEDGGSSTTQSPSSASPQNLPSKKDSEDAPVVYIDMPETSDSHMAQRHQDTDLEDSNSSESRVQGELPAKKDPGDVPVLYIDLPEAGGMAQTRDAPEEDEEEEPGFVEETILYDPFENRRIDMTKEENEAQGRSRRLDSDSDETSSQRSGSTRHPSASNLRVIARRPNTLDLYGAGSSGTTTSTPTPSHIPPMLAKETQVYGRQPTPDDGFPLSPIPVSEFPEPPPAYSAYDSAVNTPQLSEQPVRLPESVLSQPPPRTQVIIPRETPSTPIGMPHLDRKYLNCHHCGMRVHTLVIMENGLITYTAGILSMLLCLWPLVALIYCTNVLKIKNHYCPNCNKLIGYEAPFCDSKIVYVN